MRSELEHLIDVCLEEVMCPLREEASTIKLWLARKANHLECGQPHAYLSFVPDVTELFGPCSPIQHSLMSSILSSLAAAYMATDYSLHKDTCDEIVDSVLNELTIEVASELVGTEFHRKIPMLVSLVESL